MDNKHFNIQNEYIELVKKILMNDFYDSYEYSIISYSEKIGESHSNESFIAKRRHLNYLDKEYGRIWPPVLMAHTMIGRKRLDNLEECIRNVLKDDVAGDFIETGVWRGGAVIFMRACLKALGNTQKTVWVADSFEGLPPPDDNYPADKDDIHHTINELAVSKEQVIENFQKYGLLDDQVKVLKGWFSETLPKAPIESLSIIRLDGDMYSSTIDAISNLYPKLSLGGYLIVDDYCLKGCARAISDYRNKEGINDPIIDIDGTGAYWRKS